ncbi:MAG: Na+/H+ antiporter subunit E [Bacteroidetes bacterium]|nr:MAG: Na+/H+ antiporter subunit E [Bacteroidota bacterium]
MKKVFSFLLRVFRFVLFIFYYLKELVLSSLYVAWDIITPTDLMKPGIVEVPVDLKSETAIIAFANLISMTPGSLTMDMSPDKKKIYIHAMYLHDKQEFIDKMKNELEHKIRQIFD